MTKEAGRRKRGKEEDNLQNFKYLDTFYLNPQTGAMSKWIRVEHGEAVEEFRNKHGNYNVFTTIQLYPNRVKRVGGGEEMYAPLFFDIDSSRLLARDCSEDKGKKNKDGLIELGVIYTQDHVQLSTMLPKELMAHILNSGMGIPLTNEICNRINEEVAKNPDLKKYVWLKNLEQSRMDAVKILTFFLERFGLTEDEARVYFSGSKGFHILINPIVLGVTPDKNLHRFFKLIANYLVTQLGLKSLDTGSIYGHARMLRLINSIHHKSGLFKVELYHAELKGDLNDIITVLAKSPREDFYPPDIQELQLNTLANEWYSKKVKECTESIKMEELSTDTKDEILTSMQSVPACVQFILERGILKSGDRNKATMALASYSKAVGTSQQETERTLVAWVKKIPPSMTSSSTSESTASTISCVKTVYQEEKYRFACAYIRSLHGDKAGKDYEAIPCGGRNCPAHEDHAIDAEPAEEMHLSQTSRAEFTGKKVSFSALVSGKLDTPYIVPKKVRFVCRNYKYCDKPCIMHEYEGTYEREFHENDRFLIEATNQNDNNLKGVLRAHSGASCNKLSYEVLEHINVSELLVVPMADRVKSVKTTDGDYKDVDESGNEYVTRKMYAIGNDIQANSHYQIEGYVYSHPRNAMATILSQKHEPMEDSIARFELTEEVKKQFKVFQVQEGEKLDDRITMVIDDLVDNVTLVHERFQLHLALLMTYHSCLHYFFQGHLEKRGWMETVFVGDSGQAKSMCVNNLMEFCGLGTTASGEGTSRTGLVYRLEQLGERWFITWGKYPLSDRKLIAIDEFSELDPDDFGKITEARTTGVLRVDRTVNTETNARVRLILLTNPVGIMTLSRYTHGVESLKPLFATPADIRRLDLAVFLQSGDVDKSVLNAEYPEPKGQAVTADALRNSILWAWSRKPQDIIIGAPTMKMILRKADELAGKYGDAQDIPLMEPADLRKKLARMAIALAGLVHSTDDTHEKVIVLPEHVEYVVDFIGIVYDDKNCRLDLYSAKSKEESDLTDEERAVVKKALEDLDFTDHALVSSEIIDLFRRNDVLKPNEIIEMLGYERGQVNTRLAILTRHNMIKRTRDGLRKLPKFIEYLLL